MITNVSRPPVRGQEFDPRRPIIPEPHFASPLHMPATIMILEYARQPFLSSAERSAYPPDVAAANPS